MNMAHQLNAAEIQKFWDKEDTKMKPIDRRILLRMSGSLASNVSRATESNQTAFVFGISNEQLGMFRHSARIESRATPEQKAVLSGRELAERSSSVEHTYILAMHVLRAKNRYPIPLAFACTGVTGNLYAPVNGPAARSAYYLDTDHWESFPSKKDGLAPTIHKVTSGFSLRQAIAAKALTLEAFEKMLGHNPETGKRFYPGGANSILVKMMQEVTNLNAINEAGQNDPAVREAFQDMSVIDIAGRPTVQFSEAALPLIREVISDYQREIAGRVESIDMTNFKYWFTVSSNLGAVTPKTLLTHENFIGMSPSRVNELMNDGLRSAFLEVQIRFIPLSQKAIDDFNKADVPQQN